MAKKIEDIKVINVDGTPVAVDDLSDNVQNLVDVYNTFRKDEQRAKYDLIKVQSALRDVQREILMTIKQEQEAEKSSEESSDKVENSGISE